MTTKEEYKKPCTDGSRHWFGVDCSYNNGGVDPALRSDNIRAYVFNYCPWCGAELKDIVIKEEEE